MVNSLPEFENPPVVEVALSVQFEPIDGLRTPYMGAIWGRYRNKFPSCQEHPLVDPTIECFGSEGEQEIYEHQKRLTGAPVRQWFLSADEKELIQLQQDRFIRNWRKTAEEDKYPRFDSVLSSFKDDFQEFEKLLAEYQLGQIVPNQCEVTYVNHIPIGQGWENYDQIGEVVNILSPANRGEFLREMEDARFAARFLIKDINNPPLGRLYVQIDPSLYGPDRVPSLRLSLQSRGKPTDEGMKGILGFFELGHIWIVKGFADITSAKMHKLWGEKHGK